MRSGKGGVGKMGMVNGTDIALLIVLFGGGYILGLWSALMIVGKEESEE